MTIPLIRELALSAVPQSVIVTDASDPDNPIIYANDAFGALTGYDPAEVIGRNCNMLSGPDTAADVRDEMRAAVAARRRFEGLVLNYRKDGSQFWNHLTIQPMESDDRLYFVGVQHDVTERIALEASLRESQIMQALGKLSGGIAHDFNNILALVMGNAEIIAGEQVSALVAAAAREIVEAADTGSELVRRMLQFAGGLVESTELVDVNHSVRNVMMLLGRTMTDGVGFSHDLSEAVGEVQIDKTMFRTALINLALNARDAMPSGGTITIKTRRRSHPAPGMDEGVVVTVTDTGIGMDADAKRKALEPFFTTKPAGRGTGLGLPMVHRFVSQSGGLLTIDSEVGVGTSISLVLPVRVRAQAGDDQIDRPRDRLLVVEDDARVRRMLILQLDRAGYAIDDAPTAEEAIELLERGAYQAIVTDIRLGGGMSGVDLVAAVRARRPGMPILLITAHSEELDGAPSHIQGVPVLRKPFRAQDLTHAVAQLVAGDTPALATMRR